MSEYLVAVYAYYKNPRISVKTSRAGHIDREKPLYVMFLREAPL